MTARNDATSDWQQARESLSHVYWIGGVTAAGKSTIGKRLAYDFGLIYYPGDRIFAGSHLDRAAEEEFPVLYAIGVQGLIENWRWMLLQPPDKIGEAIGNIYREDLQMVVEDLLVLKTDRAVVVDLFNGQPSWELRQLIDSDRAVFLVPTEAYQKEEHLSRFREGRKNGRFVRRLLDENCPDPEATFMSGYVQHKLELNQYVREECRKHNLPLLITGGQSSLEESYKAVCEHFHLSRHSQ